MIDLRAHLEGLVGREIRTLTGNRPNRILRIESDNVIVGTEKSPAGTPVPIQWVMDGVEALMRQGTVVVDVESLGYRGAFIGAVLATLLGTVVEQTVPRRVSLHH